GQQVEARGFAGAVRPDQRVNAAPTDPETDVANGVESREFLGQSVGFENELIGQSNVPHRPSPRNVVRVWPNLFQPGRFSQTPYEIAPWEVPSLAGRLRPGICRQWHRL